MATILKRERDTERERERERNRERDRERQKQPNADEVVEQLECSFITGAKWYCHFGRHLWRFLKKLKPGLLTLSSVDIWA